MTQGQKQIRTIDAFHYAEETGCTMLEAREALANTAPDLLDAIKAISDSVECPHAAWPSPCPACVSAATKRMIQP